MAILSKITTIFLIIPALLGFYSNDAKDTEALYRETISQINYENTIETAIPQTDIYKMIEDHFNSPLAEGKTEKKAIIIGYDGCRADVLTEIDEENSGIALLKKEGASFNLNYCGGVNYPEKNTQDTSTAPGWCSILTGKWADEHGITGNSITKSMDTKTLFTSLTEEKVIDSASFITKWGGHFSNDNSTYRLEKEYCEENGLDVDFNRTDGDEASHTAVVEAINEADCDDFLFVIYEHTDSAGHSKGFSHNNPVYKDAFRAEDAYALEDINAIRARNSYSTEDWLIIITSDHGGIMLGHGNKSIQERMTFAVVL